MANSVKVTWNGDALIAAAQRAAAEAIDETTEETADIARAAHWWLNRTENLESNIVTEEAVPEGSRVTGRVGTTTMEKGRMTGWYGLILEYRTPFLRPAADIAFPHLADRIRQRMGTNTGKR